MKTLFKILFPFYFLLVFAGIANSAIPLNERGALIDLYISTHGDAWLNNNNWLGDEGTECTWQGITCLSDSISEIDLSYNNLSGPIPSSIGELVDIIIFNISHNQVSGEIPVELASLTNLIELSLRYNDLTGPIPVELGGLINLYDLGLCHNQLSGPIPPEIGNLINLKVLSLCSNELSGPIPIELGNLVNIEFLGMMNNRLSGPIPPEIGNLVNMTTIHVGSNRLSGEIPIEFLNLSNLIDSGSDFTYEAVYSDNDDLRNFLSSKQWGGGDWESTQTIAPDNISVNSITDTSVILSWAPILYAGDSGGYEVYYSETSAGPYDLFEITLDKTVSSSEITGLTPGTQYYFVLRTITYSHEINNNDVYSDFSAEIAGETTDTCIAYPDIKANGEDGPIYIQLNDPLSITISLSENNCNSRSADWWILTLYYNQNSSSWIPIDVNTFQSPIVNLPPTEIINNSNFPVGVFGFLFGIDKNPNGQFDIDQLFSDFVMTVISP